jgi:hypothetical protein
MWNCTDPQVFECYSKVVELIGKNVQSSKCQSSGGSGLSSPATGQEQFLKQLKGELERSIPKPITCKNIRWTDAMNAAANLIIQKSQECHIDYATLLVLADYVNSLLSVQNTCSVDQSGSSSSPDGQQQQQQQTGMGAGQQFAQPNQQEPQQPPSPQVKGVAQGPGQGRLL